METQKLLKKISQLPVIPVFYNPDTEITLNVISACYEGGMRVFEFTNRGPESETVFKEILANRSSYPEMALGIGTIMNKLHAKVFTHLGADFLVSPILDMNVAKVCKQRNKPWIPGCGTLTEVIKANRSGAELVKVFPGNVLGAGFIKSVLGPCPDLRLMPTGGVKPSKENLEEWFSAGAFSVGIGSSLFDKEIILPENHDQLVQKIVEVGKTVHKLKG
ncbi:MAG: hypothetical protein RLN81_00540 [Balneolaceae bacterium]